MNDRTAVAVKVLGDYRQSAFWKQLESAWDQMDLTDEARRSSEERMKGQ